MTELTPDPIHIGFVKPRGASSPGNSALESSTRVNLAELAEQLAAIAESLRQSGYCGLPGAGSPLSARAHLFHDASDKERGDTAEPLEHDTALKRMVYGEIARAAYSGRRKRAAIFENEEIFGEPAWDILLDLYIAHSEDKAVSVSSACIGSAAPPTTGLRWLGVLAEQDLVLREHDPQDQRRVLVRLTEKGLCAMDEYFASSGLTA
jgi:hypothetical protein